MKIIHRIFLIPNKLVYIYTIIKNLYCMNVFVVIPFFSDGIEVNQNDVAVFESRSDAQLYVQVAQLIHYQIVETALNLK
jgi:hypothetical protein